MIAALVLSTLLSQAYYTPEEAKAVFDQANDAYNRADHAQAKCMWQKPAEIASFKATGFEITIGQPGESNAGTVLDSQKAITMWQGSALHNDVVLNRGPWQNTTWRSLGAGINDSHACAWFSDQADPTP